MDLLLRRITGKESAAFPLTVKMRITAMAFNMIHIGFVCWAFVDQYPHPEEDGFVAFLVMMVLTPILSLVVLFRGGTPEGVKA